MSAISFKAKPFKIGSWTILLLPKEASARLPSRGPVMVDGNLNGFRFQTALEPDGRGSHWLSIDKTLSEGAHIKAGETVVLSIESTNEWPEPKVPEDLKKALATDSKARTLWAVITPMTRWDWIRWISSTGNPETRERHIRVGLSKLDKGERRPCCFNRSLCLVHEVSKNGALLLPLSSS
jgi:hypothetical protein